MKLKNLKIFFGGTLIVFSALLLVPALSQITYAQTNCNSSDCVQSGLGDVSKAFPANARTEKDIPSLVHTVIDWALYIAAIAAVIFIIIGGYMYIFSAGDSGKAGKGRATMVNALIGLTLIVLSYIIVQIVYNFLTKPTPGT